VPFHHRAHSRACGQSPELGLGRIAVLVLALALPLGLGACSLSEDITPPPDLLQPAAQTTSLATQLQPTAGPSVTPEPVDPPAAIDLGAGRAIYLDRCAACHGLGGLGDGELAQQLSNPPAAIGRAELGGSVTPLEWFRMVTVGNMARFMPPFGNVLTSDERWNVTYYALSLSQGEDDVEAGRVLYEGNCAACHGEQGGGDGPQAAALSGALADLRKPETLSERRGQDLFDLISEGSPLGMPALGTTLSDDERWHLVSYVRSLSYLPGSQAALATTEAGTAPASATLAEGTTAVAEVSGQVINGTTQQPAANLEISLRRFDGTQELEPLLGQTDSQGRFRFESVEFSSQRAVVIEATYLGVAYFSEVAQAEAGQNALELGVTIYDTSRDTTAITMDRLHLFLEPLPGQDVVRVGALALLSNSDARAIVAAGTGEGTLFFDLPKSAVNLQLQEGELGGRFIQTETGFADTLAVIPGQGSHQVVFAFDVPYTRSAKLEFPLRYPVSGEIIVVPDGMRVESEALEESGVRQIEGASYRTYSGGALAAGQTLTLRLSGKPATARTSGMQGYELVIAAAALGVVLIGAGVWGWWRSRRAEKDEIEAEAGANEERETLLQSIAALDDAYQAGQVKESNYAGQRAALKERLLDLTDDETS
jgi:mono/diheme cytochrome c family protein/5-hydroxyisourate hydrolase-like protein (transthyretin family)